MAARLAGVHVSLELRYTSDSQCLGLNVRRGVMCLAAIPSTPGITRRRYPLLLLGQPGGEQRM